MDLMSVLAQILNPQGAQPMNRLTQSPRMEEANYLTQAGAGSAMPPPMPQMAAQPLQAPQAPQQPAMAQSAPAPSGGGIGGFLSNLFQGPEARGKNQTVQYLMQQGMDEGTATMYASNKPALQQYLLQRSQGNDPMKALQAEKLGLEIEQMRKGGNRQTTVIDGKLVDTNDGSVIGDYGGSDQVSLMTPQEVEAAGLPPGVYQRSADGKIDAVGSVRDQDAGFKNEMELRKEYDMLPEVKDYKVVRSNYERIRQGVQLGTGAGDAAIVFGYMKMLDPTSVVREGEQATTRNAAGVPEAVRGMYNQLVGGGQLSGEARQQILGAAEKVYGESSANIEEVNKRYGGYADAWKLDPSRITAPTEQYDPLALPQGTPQGGGLPLPPQAPTAPAPPPPPMPAPAPQGGVTDWKDWLKPKGPK